MPSMDLRGTISVVGDLPVLALSGDVDLATVPTLRDLLLRAAFEHPGGALKRVPVRGVLDYSSGSCIRQRRQLSPRSVVSRGI